MQPTAHVDVNEMLASLVTEVRRALGTGLAGMYLYGSLTTGGFVPGVSDADVLAVISGGVDEELTRKLQRLHLEFALAHPEWDDRVEVQYMPASALASFKARRSTILAISPGEPLHEREVGADWTMNWYDVQENGVALSGPTPSTFIPRISREEFVASVRDSLSEWPGHLADLPPTRGSQAYAVLTMCRALYTCANGRQVSKQAAAEWAEAQLPEWSPLVREAIAWRLASRTPDEAPTGATLEAIHRFILAVRNHITAA
jgi:predicted nucleotidyltransferase